MGIGTNVEYQKVITLLPYSRCVVLIRTAVEQCV